jgi:hypothetical protein
MGVRYGFTILTEASRVDALLSALAEALEPTGAARLRAALPWRPLVEERLDWGGTLEHARRGIAGFSTGERGDCLSFRFDLDAEVRRYLRSSPGPPDSIGCVYTTLDVGERYAVMTATAATSGMSRLFARSRGVNATFARIATRARALGLFFDDERDHDALVAWPGASRRVPFVLPLFDPWSRVDLGVEEQLRLSGLRETARSPRRPKARIFCDPSAIDAVLATVTLSLSPSCADRVKRALPWRPARTRRVPWGPTVAVLREGVEGLSTPTEPPVRLELASHTSVSLTLRAGEHDAMLTLDAEEDLHALTEVSASLGETGVEVVVLDDGDDLTQLRLWPPPRARVPRPDPDAFGASDGTTDVDSFAATTSALSRRRIEDLG